MTTSDDLAIYDSSTLYGMYKWMITLVNIIGGPLHDELSINTATAAGDNPYATCITNA